MQLLERLSQFSDILASAKTSSVGQWNLEYLKNVIQCAIDVENEVSITLEEEIKIVYQKFISKASNEGRARPFDFQEFKSAFYSLYGTLLKNVHLSSELVSFLIDTYNFPLEDLSSIKDNISEDIQHFVKPLVTFELLVNIENILSDGLYQIKYQSAQSTQSARNLDQNNKLSIIKHEFSYKLSLTTNTNRSAARILLQDLLKFFQNCQLVVDNSIERIKSDLHNYATRLKGGMEIITHAAILSKQENDRNFPELNYIILDWITSIVVVEDADKEIIKEKISLSDNLKYKIWSLHPWLLTQLSLMHQPFFEIYFQILIQRTQQEQQYMLGKFSIELIQPKLFYQLSNLSNEMVLHYNHNNDCQVNKSNYQRLEGLLIHWELFLNIGNIDENIVYLLQQEWITFKKRSLL
ncbi:95_t:CDS:2 [Diversispora eburnea]|uniref:95_t:CDS:1 n=1 Tax=Diversispora eburnea TaxID=1213867 RepID=A0A9N8YY84_9GLOM|nr:95_t:CDS:2 [Diversispora eburnea]